MKTKYFLILLLSFLSIGFSQEKENNENQVNEHIEFLKEFYREYIPRADLTKQMTVKEEYQNQVSVLKKYCTKGLAEYILNASYDELDYDPFIQSQDSAPGLLNFLRIEKDTSQKNSYIVSFKYYSSGKLTKRVYVEYEVINTSEGCKINAVAGIRGDTSIGNQ